MDIDQSTNNTSTSANQGSMFSNAQETVKSYLPESVASYLPGTGNPTDQTTNSNDSHGSSTEPTTRTNFPNENELVNERTSSSDSVGARYGVSGHPGAQGGVGDLPGGPQESNVALLPHEGLTTTSLAPEKHSSTTPNTGFTASDSTSYSNELDRPHQSTYNSQSAASGTLGAQPGVGGLPGVHGGVGDLPGDHQEANVAPLPEDRIATDTLGNPGARGFSPIATSEETDHRVADSLGPTSDSTAAAAGTSLGDVASSTAQSTVPSADTHLNKELDTSDDTTNVKRSTDNEPKNGPSAGFDGYGEGYHPAELHPMTTPPKNANAATEPETGDTTNQPSSNATSSETPYKGSQDSHGKTGLVNKLKGEAKVIAGKIGKNEEKVEAGKKLMGK